MSYINSEALLRKLWESDIENADEFAHLVKGMDALDTQTILKAYSAKLSPCPFCGNRPILSITLVQHTKCVNVMCDLCGCQTKLFSDKKDPLLRNPDSKAYMLAIKAWNRRVKTQ